MSNTGFLPSRQKLTSSAAKSSLVTAKSSPANRQKFTSIYERTVNRTSEKGPEKDIGEHSRFALRTRHANACGKGGKPETPTHPYVLLKSKGQCGSRQKFTSKAIETDHRRL
jgi:hypothetical protein